MLDDLEQRARRLTAVLEETQDPTLAAEIERELGEISLSRSNILETTGEPGQVRGIGAHLERDKLEGVRRPSRSETRGGGEKRSPREVRGGGEPVRRAARGKGRR